MRSSLITVTFLFLSVSALAQNTGFAGKRVVLKLDAYNSVINKFPNFGVEFIATRGLTLSADLNMGTQSVKQTYYRDLPDYSDEPTLFGVQATRFDMPDKAEVSHTTIALSLRKYLGEKKLIPAPHGAFFSVGYKKGIIEEIKGNVYEGFFSINRDRPIGYTSYTAKNISYYAIQAGFGSQNFINSWLSIDFLLGLTYNKFDMNMGKTGNEIAAGVTGNFGPNVWRMFNNKEYTADKSYNIGLFLNLGVGVLLF